MTDATKRAEDFFAANPGQQYMATRGAIYTSDGRTLRPATEGDKELLELAAKAEGRRGVWSEWRTSRVGKFGVIEYTRHEGFPGWNPLTDDGDALRLAVALMMSLSLGPCRIQASTIGGSLRGAFFQEDTIAADWGKATRRVIVRAAAEIGSHITGGWCQKPPPPEPTAAPARPPELPDMP